MPYETHLEFLELAGRQQRLHTCVTVTRGRGLAFMGSLFGNLFRAPVPLP